MPQDFDIHEWRLYQANLNLLNEQIVGIDQDEDGNYIMLNTPDGFTFDFDLDDINNRLKPQYKFVLSDFLEEQEDDDDFNITTDAFDVIELRIGDIINSSDMFEKPESYKFYFDSEPHIIKRIFRSDGEDTVDVSPVGGKRGEGWEMSLEGLNSLLKNKYRIIKPLKSLRELEDDDFNITLDDEWGVKELGVGDTIIGDMWDWKKIINTVNNEHRDDHAGINRDIERWKTIYDEGITINSIETNGDDPWVYFDGNFLNWGPGINWVNNLLSPGNRIVPSINEQDDDNFSITLDDEWGVKELSNGDFITFDMLNSKTMNIWKGYSSYFPFKLEREKYDGYHVISKNGIHTFYSLDSLNNMLKPQFRVITPLNEQDNDDFNITTDVFDIIELGVGDIITPDMFESPQEDKLDAYYFRIISFQPNNKVYLRRIKYKLEDVYEIDEVNSLLKPKYQVVSPLNESEDDDFNVTLDDKWNEYDGDVEIIMKGPWGYNLVTYLENDDTGFIEDFKKLNPNITLDDYDMFVEYRTYKIKTNTGQIK
jgi:hypothetical protein